MSLQAPDHVSGCHCQHDMNAIPWWRVSRCLFACGLWSRGRLSQNQNHVELFGVWRYIERTCRRWGRGCSFCVLRRWQGFSGVTEEFWGSFRSALVAQSCQMYLWTLSFWSGHRRVPRVVFCVLRREGTFFLYQHSLFILLTYIIHLKVWR